MPVGRMVFHDHTEGDRAVSSREIDRDWSTPRARRILGLYGYGFLLFLEKVMPRLAQAGFRVYQRIVVERERKRMAFTAASFWDIEASKMYRPSSMRVDPTR